MTLATLAPRILALPADIRATLARVDGPGWYIRPDGCVVALPSEVQGAGVWWPTNPAASVAAVLGHTARRSHERIADRLDAWGEDDHAAALAIIEAHVASCSKE